MRLLAGRNQQTVGQLVAKLRLPQPTVSKHLMVLRKVGLVSAAKQGQLRRYSLEPGELKVVYDWVKIFERFWEDHLDAIQMAAQQKAAADQGCCPGDRNERL